MQPPAPPSPTDVPALVERWQHAGIITGEQAQRIRDDLAVLQEGRRSLAAEGLGYLGGVVVLVGLGYLGLVSWDDLSAGSRWGVLAGATVAMLVAGAAVPAARLGAAGKRLRGVLWAVGIVGVFATVGTGLHDVVTWDAPADEQMAIAGAGTGLAAAGLWALNRHVLQHLSTVWPTMLAANSGVDAASGDWFLASLAIWSIGVIWFVLSLRDIVPSKSGGVIGALGATMGGLLMLGEDQGPLLALGTVIALVGMAITRRDVALLSVGSIGTLIVLPFFVEHYFHGNKIVTAIVLVSAGLVLVAIGSGVVRRRRSETAPA